MLAGYSGRQLLVGLAVAALVAVLAAMVLVLQQLVARYGAVLLRLQALEQGPGAAPTAPAFALPDLDGETVSLEVVLERGRPVLVAFLDPDCAHCGELVPDLARWQAAEDGVEVLVLSTGSVGANREKMASAPSLRVLLQDDWEVAKAYEIDGTPGAVLVGLDGRIAAPTAYAVDGIRSLHADVSAAIADAWGHEHHDHDHEGLHQVEPRPLAVGDPLPDVRVTTQAGDALEVADLPDDAVLLFWRTDCGFCEQITDDVRGAERDSEVYLVTGTPLEELRASGLSSPVLRERGSELSDALGVPGTPSAARVRGGAVDSELAVGGPAVLGLLGARVRA